VGEVSAPQAAHGDPGLQPERTSLAWTRTLVSFLAVAVLSLKTAAHTGLSGAISAVLYSAVAATILVRQARRYRRHVHRLIGGPPRSHVWDIVLLAAAGTTLAAQRLWIVLGS